MTVTITPKKQLALKQLGLEDAVDVIQFFPYRYDRFEQIPYEQWTVDTRITFEAVIISAPKLVYYRGRQSLVSFEADAGFEHLRISIFNRPWLAHKTVGSRVTIVGKYQGRRSVLALQMNDQPLAEQLGIKPVYALKDKVPARWFSDLEHDLLNRHEKELVDVIPEQLRVMRGCMPRYQALCQVHFPTDQESLMKALRTLKYEEFLVFQCLMIDRRSQWQQDGKTAKHFDQDAIEAFITRLPFRLTDDQRQAVNEILADMASGRSMSRLLQGDVGCGKTIVAFIAMYACHLAGYQAVLMAPTAILASQHHDNMRRFFAGTGLKTVLLHAGLSAAQRQQALDQIADGQADLVVGTHAVFQEKVVFDRLGLIVTDEQHRFGVKQRQALHDKGRQADVLMMSATPIPRTLASSLYGDMDVSTITAMPNSAKSVTTVLVRKNSFMALVDDIEPLLQGGDQMYVVCATIEKNEDYKIRNVNEVYANLQQFYRGRHKVGLMHGQMDEDDKDDVMRRFAAHQIDILVTTTVVEVGVDVKAANLMVIYDANRFGLSQLHQLRGRIGRGTRPGHCWLLTGSDDPEALDRLQMVAGNNDGFKIAYYDLQTRGPGDMLGYRQSGLPVFALGNIILDQDLLEAARQDAKGIMPHIEQPGNSGLRKRLAEAQDHASFDLD